MLKKSTDRKLLSLYRTEDARASKSSPAGMPAAHKKVPDVPQGHPHDIPSVPGSELGAVLWFPEQQTHSHRSDLDFL